jgi:hypothetical protein
MRKTFEDDHLEETKGLTEMYFMKISVIDLVELTEI